MQLQNKLLVLFFIIGISFLGYSQKNVYNYKYIIVPNDFDFSKTTNQYQLNALSQFLFNKYGFEAYLKNNNYPSDLVHDNCLALQTKVLRKNTMFKTILTIQLVDCNGEVVYTSAPGTSREKNSKVAHQEALRDAFKSVENLHYNYKPIAETVIKPSIDTKADNGINKKPITKTTMPLPKSSSLFLEIENANYQIVNDARVVLFKLQKTTNDKVFLVKNKEAVVYIIDTNWVLAYYNDGILKTTTLKIKP